MRKFIQAILICSGFYAIGAFTNWNLDPETWHIAMRCALAAMCMVVVAIATTTD